MARKISVEIVGDSRNLERAFGRASKAGSTFGQRMRTIGKVAAAGLAGGFVAVGLALRTGFAELMEGERVMAQTRAVLKSTGGAANVSAKHVDKLATSISRMSGIDDEAVGAAENLLLTFTNIRNEAGSGNKIFDQTTKAVVDMGTALPQIGLSGAAIMIGKAMNSLDLTAQGTVRGWAALRRAGVDITPQMMKQAAAFIKANKPLEAQKLLLQELQKEFGGSAAAFGGTTSGALGKLRNSVDDVAAAFAIGFLPIIKQVTTWLQTKLANPAFIARVEAFGRLVSEKLYNAFVSVGNWFKAHWPGIRQGFHNVLSVAKRVANWVRAIANIVPGGGSTMIGLLLGGMIFSKLAGAAVKALLLLRRLRMINTVSAAGIVAPGFGGGKKGKGGLPLIGGPAAMVAASVLSAGGASGARTGAFQPGRFKFIDALMARMEGGGKLRAPERRLLGGFGDRSMSELSASQLNWLNNRLGDLILEVNGRELGRAALSPIQRRAKTQSSQRRGAFAGASLGIGIG